MQAQYAPLDSGMGTGSLSLSGLDLQNLRDAGKWARFLAIVSLVMMALAVLFFLIFGTTMMAFAGGGDAAAMTIVLIFFLAVAALYIYPLIKLYQFGSKIMTAVDSGDGIAASESYAALRSMFKFMGILTIIFLALQALQIVIMLIVGVGSAF